MMNELVLNLPRLKGKIIAIDGPAGSGKSTTAKLVAARLGYVYLDTGAMYRALTYFALANNVACDDAEKLTQLAVKLPITFETSAEQNKVYINGQDVTVEIRSPEVTRHVSEVSAHPGVRQAMVAQQKAFGKAGSIVAEGRDTTTVVFPHADLKIYLVASVEERAQRRLLELTQKGIPTSLQEQAADIERRDHYDSNRAHSPLTKAPDAVAVDTTNLTIEAQVDRIVELVKSYFK